MQMYKKNPHDGGLSLFFFLLVTLFLLKPRADTSPALDTDYGESGILGGLGHAEEHKP